MVDNACRPDVDKLCRDKMSRCHDEAAPERQAPLLPGAHEQRAIAGVLVLASALLLLGPSGYCWMSRDVGLAELADEYRRSAHPGGSGGSCPSADVTVAAERGEQHPVLSIAHDYVGEVVTSGMNGLLMMVATVLGGIGADIPGRGILAMGFATLTTFSLSSGLGNVMIETTKDDFLMSQLKEEIEEVQNSPDEERDEVVCHYRKRGMSLEDARTLADVLSRYDKLWVEHMMTEELGLPMPRGRGAAATSGLAASASFFACGMVPLLGVAVPLAMHRAKGPCWYRPQFSTMTALALAAVGLLVLGFFQSHAFGGRAPKASGALLVAHGCAAAAMALWLSERCSGLFSPTLPGAQCGAAPRQRLPAKPAEDAACAGGGSPAVGPCAAGDAQAPLESKTAGAFDVVAWPLFRTYLFRGLCWLWVAACTIVVARQLVARADYDCLRVFSWGMLTCVTTGLGAMPFAFADADAFGERQLALANAAAGGMMLAASASMLLEAHEHSGPWDWQLCAGLAVGAVFIRVSERLHSGDEEEEEESDVAVLHSAFMERRHFRKAMLIFIVMFCHSAAEGVAVGVAFSKQLRAHFGLFVSLLLAVHNVPEGLAVSLVLVPRGVSAHAASVIATLTSIPQPFMAVVAYLFVDAFRWLLPLGLAFAAGAMIYVCLHELLQEAAEQLGARSAGLWTGASFAAMSLLIVALQALTEI